MKSFPKIPIGCNVKSFSNNSNHSKPRADGDQSMASATDLFKSMTMNEIANEQHSYTNQSYLLDQTIDRASELLAKSAEPFKKEIDNFVATQAEIDALVSNIPTSKAKQSNLIYIPIASLVKWTVSLTNVSVNNGNDGNLLLIIFSFFLLSFVVFG